MVMGCALLSSQRYIGVAGEYDAEARDAIAMGCKNAFAGERAHRDKRVLVVAPGLCRPATPSNRPSACETTPGNIIAPRLCAFALAAGRLRLPAWPRVTQGAHAAALSTVSPGAARRPSRPAQRGRYEMSDTTGYETMCACTTYWQ